MGKGQIVSGGENGLYQVKMIYAYRSRVEQKITSMQQNITSYESQRTTLDAQIAAETDIKKKEALVLKRSIINLQITSLQKQIAYYQTNMPADPTVAAWCMDLTEDLSGYVGTAEIPGEATTVLIRPGYNGGATYGAARDGQLMPSIAGEPNQVLFNWMLLPGWQRHKPIYRIGTIVPDSIDFDANTCSVCLDAAYSSQQSLPAIDGAVVSDCNMGDDPQSEYLINSGEDFCSRNPSHPFCRQEEGSEINLTDTMLAQLREVNYLINGNYGRANDKSGIAVGDRWDVMAPGGSGDCEDFALTKMQKLVDDYGWLPNNLKLITAYAKNGGYHAMLGVRTTNRGLVVLDVNYDEVMESGRVPYRIDKIALTSDTWMNYTRKLEAVPIEYMTCNSAAFADGDRVIVEFTDQDWNQPKVIGFLENPEMCTKDAMVFGNAGMYSPDYSVWRYLYVQEVWQHGLLSAEVPSPYNYSGYSIRSRMLSTSKGTDCFCFGGYATEYQWYETEGGGGWTPIDYHDLHLSSKYNCNNQSWTTLSEIIGSHFSSMGFRLGNYHYCVAGARLSGNDTVATNAADKYDDSSDTSSSITNHPESRQYSMAFSINNKGYSFGGNNTVIPHQPTTYPHGMYQFSNESGAWTAKRSMPRGRTQAAAAAMISEGYIFNGLSDEARSGDTPMAEDGVFYGKVTTGWVEKYTPAEDTWSTVMQATDSYGPLNWMGTGMAECGHYTLGFLEGRAAGSVWREFNAFTVAITVKGGEPARSSQELTLQGINA